MDVLEIDAATHTQVDKVREVIISGLSIPPVRDRYKIFIIDEVHQLSGHSFNALLKSIEEPPPHVVFMMATTELQKIPETILSRSQVHEFRTISERGDRRRSCGRSPTAEQLDVSDEALALVARAADGSMRDAPDRVRPGAGVRGQDGHGARTCRRCSGLVGRDLLLDILDGGGRRGGGRRRSSWPAARSRAGYDLRLLCRELSRLVRDLMLVSVDPSRLDDPEVAPAGERERIAALAEAVLARGPAARVRRARARRGRTCARRREPRYHLEMALLRWMHLRKLVPLADLIEQLQQSGSLPPAGRPAAGGPGGAAGGSSPIRRSFPERPSAPPVRGRRSGRHPRPHRRPRSPAPAPPAAAGSSPSSPSRPQRPAAARPAPSAPPEQVFEADSDEAFEESSDAPPSRPAPAPARPAPAAPCPGRPPLRPARHRRPGRSTA